MIRNFLVLLGIVALAGLAGELLVAGPSTAHAQQKSQRQPPTNQRRLNLLDLLFGGGLLRQPVERNEVTQQKARRVDLSVAKSKVSRGPAPKVVIEKAENARKVLVVGDFMAGALSDGLEQLYAENPNVVFVDNASALSGLVRDDVVDWPRAVPAMIEEVRPAAVVILVGMNDRQLMRLASGRVDKLSDEWKAEYEARIERLIKAARARGSALIWVGLPPVGSGAMNTDYLVLNEFYRAKTEAAGGEFVDVWDGFTDADGNFVNAGPDVNGQIVRLRNSDGINMTQAGKNKLAFYAGRELRKIAGLESDAVLASLPGDSAYVSAEPGYDPAISGRTLVVLLDSPAADGGDVLEGGEDPAENETEKLRLSTSHDLVFFGATLKPRPGRIDESWGTPSARVAASEEELKNRGVAKSERSAAGAL